MALHPQQNKNMTYQELEAKERAALVAVAEDFEKAVEAMDAVVSTGISADEQEDAIETIHRCISAWKNTLANLAAVRKEGV
jgi:enamine deaminase RidA (YjgF/YER057c/UK114 family)